MLTATRYCGSVPRKPVRRKVRRFRGASTGGGANPGPVSPWRIDEGGRALNAPTALGWFDFMAALRNSLRALRPLRSDSRSELVDEALRAAMKSNQPRRPRNDAPRTARPRLCRDSVGALPVALHQGRHAVACTPPCGATRVDLHARRRSLVARHPCWLSGRRYPARAHSGAAAMRGLGLGAQVRASFHARRSCLNGAERSEFFDASPRPRIAAKS